MENGVVNQAYASIRPARSNRRLVAGVAAVLTISGLAFWLRSPSCSARDVAAKPAFEIAEKQAATAPEPSPRVEAEPPAGTPARHPAAALALGVLRDNQAQQAGLPSAQSDDPAVNVIRPEDAHEPTTEEFREAYQMMARVRKTQPARRPDPELAQGLLDALKSERDAVNRFALANAYLDEIEGITEPNEARRARARLAEVGAGPEAL